MNKIKIAMLSINHGHARGYFNPLLHNKNFEFVAVSVAKGYEDRVFLNFLPESVKVYDSDEKLLDENKIDAVILAGSNEDRPKQAIMCANRGIHIYSMKIPTFIDQEYDQFEKAVKDNDVICTIELELRKNAQVYRAKQLLEQGAIGDLLAINAFNFSHNPSWWLPWQADPKGSYGKVVSLEKNGNLFRGGALSDHPHIFDVISYISGLEFEYLYAFKAPNLRKDIMVEDMLSVIGKLQNGVIFSLDPSFARNENHLDLIGPGWEKDPKRVEVCINLIGTKGAITLDCFHPNVAHTGLPNHNYTVKYANIDDRCVMLDEFANSIREHKQSAVNIFNHRKVIKVMNACYDSIYNQKKIVFN